MKAIVAGSFGAPDVLHLQEVEKPTPRDREILVRVRATTVSAGDIRMRTLNVPPLFWLPARMTLGFTKPKHPIYGMELAGDVEAVGKDVTRFKVGDQVFASTLAEHFGAYAEYKCVPEGGVLSTKPQNMSYEEAAAVPIGGPTALRLLRKAGIRRGQKVLIYGASGSVGTYTVQVARHFGAEVTGACSAANLEMVRSLGADEAVDYTQDGFLTDGTRYDVIADSVGKCPKSRCAHALAPGGAYVSVAKLTTKQSPSELAFIKELIEAGEVRAVIDRRYPLEQMAEAHRYVEAGHKKGNVVITLT
jgi:NADPH:quinone reductase-like Zn-dependent oxidoreductase